ncbi:MAG: serine hydrolase [Simkaniaceae bacterium]|nr:MAG: serine hydrolase [Simkaniaceae bacterium]
MKTLILTLFFLPSLYIFAEEQGIQKHIEELTQTFVEDHSIKSIAVMAIGRENHEKFEQIVSKGNLSIKSPIPVNDHSEFRIGPITQIFTAAALSYFVQEGQVSLNDPVSKFVPKSMKLPSYKGKEITLGDLATHTSGLPDMPYSLSSRSSFSVSQMYRFLSKYELTREPGTKYEYSNFGYAFLANLLSRLSKRTLPDLLNQMIFQPLSLKDTTFTLTQEQKSRLVTGYEIGKGVSPLLNEKIYSVFIGSGGLYSTPKDMLTFLSFNMRKERTSLNAILPIMQAPYHSFKNFKMGLGWKITSFETLQEKLYSIEGNLFGFGMYMGMIPETDTGVVILYNHGEFSPTFLADEILKTMNRL